MGKINVFLDSNVLFSASYSGERSTSYILFKLQERGFISIFISNLLVLETVNNLGDKKPEKLGLLKELIDKTTVLDDVIVDLPILSSLPAADRIILSTAIANSIKYFLTGNTRDFKDLYGKTVGNTLILKPRDFLHKHKILG